MGDTARPQTSGMAAVGTQETWGHLTHTPDTWFSTAEFHPKYTKKLKLIMYLHRCLHACKPSLLRRVCPCTCVLAGPHGLEEQRFCPAVSWDSLCKSKEYIATADCAWGVRGRQQAAPSYGHIRAPFGWGRVTYCHTAQLHLRELPCRFISPVQQVTPGKWETLATFLLDTNLQISHQRVHKEIWLWGSEELKAVWERGPPCLIFD